MNNTVKVFAPATISNVGCGFDTIGFAINEPGDIVKLKLRKDNKVLIKSITGDKGLLPRTPEKNTCTFAILEFLKANRLNNYGFDVFISKKMPIGSGLGSSAASAVAGVFAANELLNKPLDKKDLLTYALRGESIASGAIHADNVAPSLLGGFILIRDYNPLDIIQLPVPQSLYCAVVYPHISIETKEARKLIKKNVSISKARKHFGNIGSLVNSLFTNDITSIAKSIQDEISEPARAQLIPGYYDIKNAALDNGALGCSISGSGPSIFAFANSKKKADTIVNVMRKEVENQNLKCSTFVSKINSLGPRIIK